MKNFLKPQLALVFIALALNGYGQFSTRIDIDDKIWAAFKKATLNVVLTADSNISSPLKKAVEQNWKFSKYRFINYTEYEKLCKDPNNFFLSTERFRVESKNSANGMTYTVQDQEYLYLYYGEKRNGFFRGHVLGDLLLGNTSEPVKWYADMLPVYIRYFQWYCGAVDNKTIASNGDFKKVLNENTPKIKERLTYVLDRDLTDKTASEADIKKEYAGEVKVISENELKAIISKNADANIFVCVKNDPKLTSRMVHPDAFHYVYNIKTGEMLYQESYKPSGICPAGICKCHLKQWK